MSGRLSCFQEIRQGFRLEVDKMAVRINKDKCMRCAGCTAVCPKSALELTDAGLMVDEKLCIECGLCVKACPVGAPELPKKR